MVQAVLWDLDGVLVDSARFHFEAYRDLLGSLGRSLAEEEFQQLFGQRNEEILRRLLGPGLSDEEIARLGQRKEELFRAQIQGRVEALPGAEDLVRRLNRAGLRQAIVSSTPHQNIKLVLASLNLNGHFDAVVGAEDVQRGKPDPQGFLLGAQRLGVEPRQCVVLEDAPKGVAAAKAAGMLCIAVATTRPTVSLTAADLVVPSLTDRRAHQFLGVD